MTTVARVPLTDRQREILAWVSRYIDDHGYAPTIRDLCQAFNFASKQGAACHLGALRKNGYVTWNEGQARTLRVVEEVVHGE